jgi:hypothetical protein
MLAVLITTTDPKLTIPASFQTLVTEAVDILQHTYDRSMDLCLRNLHAAKKTGLWSCSQPILAHHHTIIFLSWSLSAVFSAILPSHLFTISTIHALAWSYGGFEFVMMAYRHGRRK